MTTAEAEGLRPNPDILVDPAWLEARLGDPKLVVLDATVWMTPQPVGPSICRSGRPEWEAGHVPGSHHVSMAEDFADPGDGVQYRLPGQAAVAERLRRLGIDEDSTIVLYGAGYLAPVTRLFWVFSISGARDVRLLDGGWERWLAEGRPVSTAPPADRRGNFTGRRFAAMEAGREAVLAAIGDPSACLINALNPEQFAGTGGPHYGRPGRIPGSVNLPLRAMFDAASKRFHDLDRLRAMVAATGAPEAGRIIAYCGGGIAASGTFLVLSMLGYRNVALYDGSLLQWSRDASLPMVTDASAAPGEAA
jgi:thiosulfate/3-mercaptopyruvate sulfurtransferase